MNRLSLDESLKLLAPASVDDDEQDEPVTTKPVKKKRVKTPTRSPVRIPKISPAKKFSPREKIVPIEHTNSLYDKEEKEDNDEQIEIENKGEKKDVAPHTPTRFRIETPRTPTVNLKELSEVTESFTLKDKLREYRYSILKYLIDENNSVNYAVCFDPNGQIIFIDLDTRTNTKTEDNNTVKLYHSDNELNNNSFQNAILSNITGDALGAVFYDNKNYMIAKRQDNAEFSKEFFTLSEDEEMESFSNLCHTYLLIRLSELEKEPQYILQSNKRNYQIIQQQMLLTNKETFNGLVTSVNDLTKSLKNFDKSYNKYSDNMIEDWCLLGTFSKEYYDKYSKGKLTEDDKNNFDKVSLNMYARFQNFNEQIFMLYDMKELSRNIDTISEKINNIEKNIKDKDNLYSGKVIDLDEIQNML